jgi:hypothetical protein
MNISRMFVVIVATCMAILPCGCGAGDGDGDDVAEQKEPIPIEQVPPAVLATAKRREPELTWFAAAKDKYQGKDSIEIRGKAKNGKIKELEIAPDGTFLGID